MTLTTIISDLDETLMQSGKKLKCDVANAINKLTGKNSITPDEVKGDWFKLAESYGISKDAFDKEMSNRKSWTASIKNGEAPLFADTRTTLEMLANLGYDTHLLSRSTPEYTAEKLTAHDISKYFTYVAVTDIKAETKMPEARQILEKRIETHGKPKCLVCMGDKPEDVAPIELAKEYKIDKAIGILINRTGKPTEVAKNSSPDGKTVYVEVASITDAARIIFQAEYGCSK